jgi:hypothetical protein
VPLSVRRADSEESHLATMTRVGVPHRWLFPFGAVKAIGVLGLLIGCGALAGHGVYPSVPGGPLMTGRTSTVSPVASTTRAATAIARSWLAQSTIAKLTRTSLASAYGPSMTVGAPSRCLSCGSATGRPGPR